MEMATHKTPTDVHWGRRVLMETDHRRVNNPDLVQRALENEFIFEQLRPTDRILEVGCGNGYLSEELRERVAHLTSFDFAETMIANALGRAGERNNRFFVGSVLDPKVSSETYDAVVCVRVLINLASHDEQRQAIRNMAGWTRPGGRLILVEGYLDGFNALNQMRQECGLATFAPAPINLYPPFSQLSPTIEELFEIASEWHSGFYDVLTRVLYPLLVGAENATGPGDFHDRIAPLAHVLNPAELAPYGRLRGLSLRRRADS